MTIVTAFEDVKLNQVRLKGDGSNTKGGVTHTPYFEFRQDPDRPHASLNQLDPGRFSDTHFHMRDQFQVVVGGKGTIGRHDLAPYGVHFSRAYTPYGPLVADAGAGLTFFVMRARRDSGAQRFPANKDKLKLVPGRQPWQVTGRAMFPAMPSGAAAEDIALQAIPGIKDETGLAAYTLRMAPNSKTYAPDSSRGDGQYIVVVKGSLLHDDRENLAWALAFVEPKQGPFEIRAGSAGLEAIVLNFPQPQMGAAGAAANTHASAGFKVWQCTLCAFVYDEAAGLPQEGIAPGTLWQDVPESWSCPDCSASKADFQMAEV
jgi:rubredoxin